MSTGWIVRRGRKQTAPLPLEKLIRLAKAGKVLPDDLVRREDEPKWQAAWTLRDLFDDAAAAVEPNFDGPTADQASEPSITNAQQCDDLAIRATAGDPVSASESSPKKTPPSAVSRTWLSAVAEVTGRPRVLIGVSLLIVAGVLAGRALKRGWPTPAVSVAETVAPISASRPATATEPVGPSPELAVAIRPMLAALTTLHDVIEAGPAAKAGTGISFGEYQQGLQKLDSQESHLARQFANTHRTATDSEAMKLLTRACRFYHAAEAAWQRDVEWKPSGYDRDRSQAVRPDLVEARLNWAFADSVSKRLKLTLEGRGESFVCPVCGGSKRLACPLCNGSGKCYDYDACKGTGVVACVACNGTGHISPPKSDHLVPNVPTSAPSETCSICAGKGTLPCPGCAGTGHCRRCEEHGTLPCAACEE